MVQLILMFPYHKILYTAKIHLIRIILLIFIGKHRLGELMMKVGSVTTHTPTYTPSVTTELTRGSSSSVGRLSTPISSIIIDDKIIYDANDSFNFLSNCYRASFKLDGKEWPTVLHYFVAKKFDLKKHHVSKILSLKSCEEVHLYSRNPSFQSVSYYYYKPLRSAAY